MYKKSKLDNDLRIVTNRMSGAESVSLGIWIKIGGRYEQYKLKGAAHFIEHLLFKGSKEYSCTKIKESIEGIGGSLNGFTSEELTCYLVKIPARHINTAIDVLSDMVINPLFRIEDIKKERAVILEEIKMYKDLPQSYVHELLYELLWPNQPLGQGILGTNESITQMTRGHLVSFKGKYYTSSNIVVSAAGSVDHEKLTGRISGIFSHLAGSEKNSFLPVLELQVKPQLNILDKETEQTHLAIGFHSFKREHPLKHALGLLNVILGGNMSSRMFNEVREKRGLAYEIATQVKWFSDTGAFFVHAGIDNRKTEEAIEVILKELLRSKNRLVSEDEFKRAKDFYLGQLVLALEDTLDNMFWIGETTSALDKTYTLRDIIEEVNKIKRRQLQEAAEQIFINKKLNLAIIGPVKNKEKIILDNLRMD